MSDDDLEANEHRRGHHYRRRASKEDKRLIHHNHYKHGSVVSSYTAINGQTGVLRPQLHQQQRRTTPFKSCRPKGKKRIELVIKQGGGIGYAAQEQIQLPQTTIRQVPQAIQFQQPQTTFATGACAPPPLPPAQYYPGPQYAPMEPIYEPPPPARRYEVYRRTEEDDRKYQQMRRDLVSEGTGASMAVLPEDAKRKRISSGTGPSHVTFADKVKKGEIANEGTATSMMLDNTPKLLIIKRDEHMPHSSHYTDFTSAPRVMSEQTEQYVSKSRTEVREDELCPLCHKGWYVKKFTWSGIISAIFCFPCGIYFCFKMRVYVCSFCGEQPVGEFVKYKEADIEKIEGNEESRSRLIPPQKVSNWTPDKKREDEDSDKDAKGQKKATKDN